MGDTKHPCPGCGKEVPFELLACKDDWLKLPKPLRTSINRAWRSGDLNAWSERRAEAVTLLQATP